jgi:hypothetical protein
MPALEQRERVAAISAFTRVFDALWRRDEGCSGPLPYPIKAAPHPNPLPRALAFVARESLRAGRGSPTEFAAPLCLIATKLTPFDRNLR